MADDSEGSDGAGGLSEVELDDDRPAPPAKPPDAGESTDGTGAPDGAEDAPPDDAGADADGTDASAGPPGESDADGGEPTVEDLTPDHELWATGDGDGADPAAADDDRPGPDGTGDGAAPAADGADADGDGPEDGPNADGPEDGPDGPDPEGGTASTDPEGGTDAPAGDADGDDAGDADGDDAGDADGDDAGDGGLRRVPGEERDRPSGSVERSATRTPTDPARGTGTAAGNDAGRDGPPPGHAAGAPSPGSVGGEDDAPGGDGTAPPSDPAPEDLASPGDPEFDATTAGLTPEDPQAAGDDADPGDAATDPEFDPTAHPDAGPEDAPGDGADGDGEAADATGATDGDGTDAGDGTDGTLVRQSAAGDGGDDDSLDYGDYADLNYDTDAGGGASAGATATAAGGASAAVGGTGGSNLVGHEPEAPPDDEEMPLSEHIEEMVVRLGYVVVAAAVGTAVALPISEGLLMGLWGGFDGLRFLSQYGPVADSLLGVLWNGLIPQPCNPPTAIDGCPRLYSPLEKILAQIKVAGLLGVLVAMPVFVYQTYLFMRPGLYRQERRYYLAAVPTSLVLGAVGMLFAYFLILPGLFRYFVTYSQSGVDRLAFGLKITFDLIVTLLGSFAVVFQIPLFVMLAIMMGVTDRRWLEARRIYFWGGFVGLGFLMGGVDLTGMAPIAIAATMIGLFEGTLALLRWTEDGWRSMPLLGRLADRG